MAVPVNMSHGVRQTKTSFLKKKTLNITMSIAGDIIVGALLDLGADIAKVGGMRSTKDHVKGYQNCPVSIVSPTNFSFFIN